MVEELRVKPSISLRKVNLSVQQLLEQARKLGKDLVVIYVSYRNIYVSTYLNPFRRIIDEMKRIGLRYHNGVWIPAEDVGDRIRRTLHEKGWEAHIEEHMNIAKELAAKLAEIFDNAVFVIVRSKLTSADKNDGVYLVEFE